MAIKVLVVDDSAFMRKLISEILNEQPDIEVVGTARNGLDALNKLDRWEVDVLTLDLEMPVLDGLSTIKRIMASKPMPILVLASTTERSSESTIKALSYGAIDFIAKPSGNISLDLRKVEEELVSKVRSLAGVVVHKPPARDIRIEPTPKPPAKPVVGVKTGAAENIVVIGSSTGGPKALEELFLQLPADLDAGVLVVQHMPKNFTKSLAARLDNLSQLEVREAQEGDTIKNGLALVAPGDFHMEIDQDKKVRLNQDPPVKYLRPAIDVTMLSLVNVFYDRIVGVVLTGMGNDGAEGMAAIKERGGFTIVQDKDTSTIFSMPKAVYEMGNADYVLPIEQIADSITKLVNRISGGS